MPPNVLPLVSAFFNIDRLLKEESSKKISTNVTSISNRGGGYRLLILGRFSKHYLPKVIIS